MHRSKNLGASSAGSNAASISSAIIQSDGTDRGREDGYELHREGISALRAKVPRRFSRRGT
jgi:hypothetical protein